MKEMTAQTARHIATYRALQYVMRIKFTTIAEGLVSEKHKLIVRQEFQTLLEMLEDLSGDSPEEMIDSYCDAQWVNEA